MKQKGDEEEDENAEEPSGSKQAKPKKSSSSKKSSEDGPPKKKKKKEGPKRALTSFIYFSNHHRPAIKEANPTFGIGEMGKALGAMWKEATAEEKEPFEQLANKDKDRYAMEVKEFQRTGILPGKTEKSVKSDKPMKTVKSETSGSKTGAVKKEFKSAERVEDSDEDDF